MGKPKVKECLIRNLERYDGPFAVLLSGGADSHANLFALLEMGADVHVYSCTLEDRESRDFICARRTAEIFDLPFTPVILPTDLDQLLVDIRENMSLIGTKGKVEVEALWAFRKAVDIITEPSIVSGLSAGMYFCLTKKGSIHYAHTGRIDEYRRETFKRASNPNNQGAKMKRYSKSVGKKWINPWITRGMLKTFLGTTWEDVNKPRQKEAIRADFEKYFAKTKVFNQRDMHKGDSGMSELFAKLLEDPKVNVRNHKSVVGIYNMIRAEELARVNKGPGLF